MTSSNVELKRLVKMKEENCEDIKFELEECKSSYLEVMESNSKLALEWKTEIQNFKCKDLPSKKYVDSMEENLMKETSRSICKDICSTSDEVLDMAGNTDKIEAENKMLKEAYMKLMDVTPQTLDNMEIKVKDLVAERDDLQGKIANLQIEAKSKVVTETEKEERNKKSVEELHNQIV